MLRYKFIDTFNQFSAKTNVTGTSMYKGFKVSTKNAEWFLFQIGRDIQISRNIIDIGLRFDDNKKNYSYDERDIHSSVLKAYIHFISDWEKDVKVDRKRLIKDIHEKNKLLENDIKKKTRYKIELEIKSLESQLKNINERIKEFVEKIIDTIIIIDDNKVYLFSNHDGLIEKIKQTVLESTFTFKGIDLERAKSW